MKLIEEYFDVQVTPEEDKVNEWCERADALVDLFRTLDPTDVLGGDDQ